MPKGRGPARTVNGKKHDQAVDVRQAGLRMNGAFRTGRQAAHCPGKPYIIDPQSAGLLSDQHFLVIHVRHYGTISRK